MIGYKYADLFMQDSIDKQLIIQFDNTTITNEDLFYQSLTLEESLCSEQELRFGSCEASVLKFKVANIVAPMKDKWITVKMVLEGHADEPFIIGRYKVEEDKLTADRMWRDVTAYDAMHDIINADASAMAAWYNRVFPNKNSTMKLKQFRTSFMNYFGIEQVLPQGGLVNDNMTVEKTIEPEQISGKDIITAICEINGCFGHIGRDGKFHYIYLPQDIEGLYPANDLYPADDLFPRDPGTTAVGANGSYIPPCKYEDFVTNSITKLQIRQKENDIGAVVGSGDNCYIIEDNFIAYGKSHNDLQHIANNALSKMTNLFYRPFSVDAKGNPCFEVGDPIRIVTNTVLVETYILQRTLKGIQALRDSYSADGVEKYTEQVNGVHKSIIQLKGRTNVIVRTVEENRIEMIDITNGLSNTISVTAAQIRTELKAEQQRAEGAETSLSNTITATAAQLRVELAEETKRAGDEERRLSNTITATANELSVKIRDETTRAQNVENSLSTDISALAGKIVLKVRSNGEMATVRLDATPESGSLFEVKAKNINMTATELINFMSGGDLNLTGKNIKITSDNFKVDKDGNVTCKNIKCDNIKAFSISTEAKSDFNSEVSDSEAMRLARQAISDAASAAAAAQSAADAAKSAAATAQQAADVANTTVNNLVNTVIPDLNSAIQSVSNRVTALENK